MADESLYITTNEAALAVVATAMKKARLSIDTLIINSFTGGMLFSAGGMLHLLVQAKNPEIMEINPGIVQLLQGILYPIGLFYVVIMGVDLFNSNILFFTVAVARNAVTVLDLLISWIVSWWFNLVGNIFVCYIICHYSSITASSAFVKASIDIVMEKAEFTFVETLIKGMAGNFFVCLAIYLQLMAKPIHVKFFMMLIPIFTFVSMGFTHSVADMFLLSIGLINKAPISVGKIAWKVMLPGFLGNIIGGSFFALLLPWYLHIVVVERDSRRLNLPVFELRDEQPELNQDSRVVRVKHHGEDVDEEEEDELENNELEEKLENIPQTMSSGSQIPQDVSPQVTERNISISNGSISRFSTISRSSTGYMKSQRPSPKNVFPVYGMGRPLSREKTIATGRLPSESQKSSQMSQNDPGIYTESDTEDPAEYIGEKLRRIISRKSKIVKDLESQRAGRMDSTASTSRRPSIFPRYFSNSSTKKLTAVEDKLQKAGIRKKANEAANDAAGVADVPWKKEVLSPTHSAIDEESISPIAHLNTDDVDGSTSIDSSKESYKIMGYNPDDNKNI
ncbi:hypothetical protein CAAN1_01S12134 [[Candida] anglica]|uniref:Formate/nitrite transporter n=1 Tax=[Candida] anglica TaxID=148631 RepID=A0ABP0EKH1_9ASCO